MSGAVAVENLRHLGRELSHRAIPATVSGVHDLRHGQLAAIKVMTSDVGEPVDVATVVRTLRVMSEVRRQLPGPVIFDVPFRELRSLPPAQPLSSCPLIVVIEADELFEHPAAFLDAVAHARRAGWEIGLRDVGADYASLAALAVVEPSVIVYAHEHLLDPFRPLGLETVQAVTAYTQSTGASVIAGRLHTKELLTRATSLSTTLGWGSAVVTRSDLTSESFELALFIPPLPQQRQQSCYELAASRHLPQRTDQEVLDALSERIEQLAVGAGPSTVVCAGLRDARNVSAAMWRRYDRLSSSVHLVTLLATNSATPKGTAATVIELSPHDELSREWVVLALGPTAAVVLAARAESSSRRHGHDFSYVLSYDRELVTHAARSMLSRTR